MENLCNCDWDDTELIEMYEESMRSTKEVVAKRVGLQNGLSNNESPLTVYTIGTPCRAVYDEDNLEYEATIQEIEEDDQYVIVKFVGYENEQRVLKSDLKKSHGLQERRKQIREAELDQNDDIEDAQVRYNLCNEAPAPPPFDCNFANVANINDEEFTAINAMINAWYLSGYYTGYYQAVKSHSGRST